MKSRRFGKTIAVPFLVVTFFLTTQSALAQQANVIVSGAGTTTCASILQMGTEKGETRVWPVQFMYLTWTQGYLTALGVAEHAAQSDSAEAYGTNLSKSPAIGIANAIAAACRKRTQEKLELISYRLYRQLGGTLVTQLGVLN